MKPLVHIARCRNSRWVVRRWYAGTEPTAYRDRRARAGATVRFGRWLVSVALLRGRSKPPVRVSPRWADQIARDPDDDRDRRGRRRWSR